MCVGEHLLRDPHSHEHLCKTNRSPNPAHTTHHSTDAIQRTIALDPRPLKLHPPAIAIPIKAPLACIPTMTTATGRSAKQLLDAGGQADAELGQQRRQGAARDQRHDDQHEDLHGVFLDVVEQVAPEAAQLRVGPLQEAVARGALVVGRGGVVGFGGVWEAWFGSLAFCAIMYVG